MSQHVFVVEDGEAVAHAALRRFVAAAEYAISVNGVFNVALSGGHTPERLFRLLAKGEPTANPWPFDWSKVQVYFVDERCVPPQHEESNFRMADGTLLSHVPIPRDNVHRMRGEIEPNEAAREYGLMLKERFPADDAGMDLMLVGMGEDGHTASLFPHTAAVNETKHRCVANYAEKSTTGKSWRITLTAPFINRSAEVMVLVEDANKAGALHDVLDGPRDPQRLPMQLIQPTRGKLVWIVDEAANGLRGQGK
jgi:6-phosphogluconolactonase